MANDQQNHIANDNDASEINIRDGLSAAELFAHRDGLTYK